MNRTYTQRDITDWAGFSGDYNPVHFDQDIARKNGLNDIIVQGMLALQQSKRLLSRQNQPFNRVKYQLKKPTYRDVPLTYGIKDRDTHIALDIRTKNTASSITGRAFSGLEEPVRCKNEIAIGKAFIRDQYNYFGLLYPDIFEQWILLDSFLFSVCFKYQNGDPFYLKSLKIQKEPDKTKVTTLQIDQDISLFPGSLSNLVHDIDNLSFFFEDTDLVKQDYAVISQLVYQVYHKNKILYQSSMGSLTRALEASRLASEQ